MSDRTAMRTRSAGRRRRRQVLPLLGLLAAACGAAKDCTAMGCQDGWVFVRIPADAGVAGTGTLTVCVDDRCREVRFGPTEEVGRGVAVPGMEAGDSVTVTLAMADGARYTGEAATVVLQPNGPGCGPTCVNADVVLAPDGTARQASPSA